jgi:hypothetical protein
MSDDAVKPDPSNSPPEGWTEPVTEDENSEVAMLLAEELEIDDEASPKTDAEPTQDGE